MEQCQQIKYFCTKVLEDLNDSAKWMREIQKLLPMVPCDLVKKNLSHYILSLSYPIFKNISNDKNCFKDRDKEVFMDVFRVVFEKARTDNVVFFLNFCGFLTLELYDPKTHKVTNISEEYKLSILQCWVSLTKSLSWDALTKLYKKANIPQLSQIVFIALEIAKNEKLRILRITALELLMCLSQVHDGADATDAELRCCIADVFMFFLPGLACGLRNIAFEDEKSGHKVIAMALQTWGRIVALQMEDYNSSDNKLNLLSDQIKEMGLGESRKIKWKSESEVKDYIQTSQRSVGWYKETDEMLHKVVQSLFKLVQHSHPKVRLELAQTGCLLVFKCKNTIPKSTSFIVHILIALSQDSEIEINSLCSTVLDDLAEKFSSDSYIYLMQNLEEKFYDVVNSLPRTFNRKDVKEQSTKLNLLIGYINLFGNFTLSDVLLSPARLQHLLKTLLHISEFETSNVHLLEEIANPDLETYYDSNQWKQFRYFHKDEEIRSKLEEICGLFCKYNVDDVVTDFLLDTFLKDLEYKCEATFLLNHIYSEKHKCDGNNYQIKAILRTYLEPEHWNLILTLEDDDLQLKDVRKNILQVCLQTEGVGNFAAVLRKEFDQYLLKSLYLILERAGSSHPLIRQAGLATLNKVIKACGYNNVTEFVNINSDYFAYHVTRKLNKLEYNREVLNVLTVVMDNSTVDVLPSLSNVIEVVLTQSCDKYQHKYIVSYLRVFNIFVKCIRKWFHIKVVEQPIKSKLDRQKEYEEFKISGVTNITDFSDNIMGKTAEEMYEEDMKKSREDLENYEEQDEYKKPTPPPHINMTVAVLRRSLHFLPSKDKRCKLLVLEILRNGLEVIKDWEDELLPLVHQIWSPLVDRFAEHKEPLVVHLSFQLLVVLAKLSKDFIRARTTKDVLPQILSVMKNLAKESYLKDVGSSYRCTQAYKLQLAILEGLGLVAVHLEIADDQLVSIMDAVCVYLSRKQPLPLQEAAVGLFKMLISYDPNLVQKHLRVLRKQAQNVNCAENIGLLLHE